MPYFQKKGIEEFAEVYIGLKPFDKDMQTLISLPDEKGNEIREIEITKLKSGEIKLREKAFDNTWMKNTLDTFAPGELIMRIWPLYIIGLGLLILYLGWKGHWFF